MLTLKCSAASAWVIPVASMVSMMIFGLGFELFSIFKAWRIDVSTHRFSPCLGSFSFRDFYRNDVVRHWCWLDRNDLMRHAERCLRTRHHWGHHEESRDVFLGSASRLFASASLHSIYGGCLMVCVWVPSPHKEMDQNDYCGETRSG